METLKKILFEENDAELRKVAVYALQDMDSEKTVAILLQVARNDVDLEVRKAAIRVLGEIGTPEARAALMEILNIKVEE